MERLLLVVLSLFLFFCRQSFCYIDVLFHLVLSHSMLCMHVSDILYILIDSHFSFY